MPLLVKFIDAQKDLSVQVHPNDEMAKRVHGKMGKTEMWYVIDAEPDSFLYAGFNRKITKEEYKRRVEDGTIIDVLAKHQVKPGDVFYLPAGRVHAICGGILLAEVQQSSDVTYRIWRRRRSTSRSWTNTGPSIRSSSTMPTWLSAPLISASVSSNSHSPCTETSSSTTVSSYLCA